VGATPSRDRTYSFVLPIPAPANTRFQSAFWLPVPTGLTALGGGHPRSMCVGMEAIGSLALHIGHGASSVWRELAIAGAEVEAAIGTLCRLRRSPG
jgi:hypothetical protein